MKWATVYVYDSREAVDPVVAEAADYMLPWPSSGVLDREKAKDLLNDIWADSRAMRFTIDEWVDRLAECVVPDPRLARIAALPAEVDPNGLAWLSADDVAEVLGGGPA